MNLEERNTVQQCVSLLPTVVSAPETFETLLDRIALCNELTQRCKDIHSEQRLN